MKSIIKLSLISILSLVCINALAGSVVGNYKCNRMDPTSNSTVTYPLSVSSTGDTYTFQWMGTNNYPVTYGTGVSLKDVNNVISVVFWDAKDNTSFGNEMFVLQSDGSLNGKYVMQSDTKVNTETCTKS